MFAAAVETTTIACGEIDITKFWGFGLRMSISERAATAASPADLPAATSNCWIVRGAVICDHLGQCVPPIHHLPVKGVCELAAVEP